MEGCLCSCHVVTVVGVGVQYFSLKLRFVRMRTVLLYVVYQYMYGYYTNTKM